MQSSYNLFLNICLPVRLSNSKEWWRLFNTTAFSWFLCPQSPWRRWSALGRWKAVWVARCLCPVVWVAQTSMRSHGTAMEKSSTLATMFVSLGSTERTWSWRECRRVTVEPTSASPGRARCLHRILCKSSLKVKYADGICSTRLSMYTHADQEPRHA